MLELLISPLQKTLRTILFAIFLLAISACSGQGFNVKQLAKSDIDMMSDIVFIEAREELKGLLVKFYKRNPRQLALVPEMTVEKRLTMIYQNADHLQFDELLGRQEVAAMSLAFDPDFNGDRVFALMVGLTGMLRKAYNYDGDFFTR